MSDENTGPALETYIDPELEARVVAWVLGEASDFETAELERIVAAMPELGIFKRRIEAVHGLVGRASRIDADPMRLAPDRREKLLQTLGGIKGHAPAAVVAMPQAERERPRLFTWIAGIAACLALTVLLTGIFFPALNASKTAARTASQEMTKNTMQMYAQGQIKTKADPTDKFRARFQLGKQITQAEPMPTVELGNAMGTLSQPKRLAALDSLKESEQALQLRPTDRDGSDAANFASDVRAPNEVAQAESQVAGENTYSGGTTVNEGLTTVRAHALQGEGGGGPGGRVFGGGDATGAGAPADAGQVLMDKLTPDGIAPSPEAAMVAAPAGDAYGGGGGFAGGSGFSSGAMGAAGSAVVAGDADSSGGGSALDAPAARAEDAPTGPAEPESATQQMLRDERKLNEARNVGQTGGKKDVDTEERREELNRSRDLSADQASNNTRSELLWEVDKGWELPVHRFGVKHAANVDGLGVDNPDTRAITEKLNRIIIPKLDFRDATLSEAIEFLKQKSIQLDTQEPDPSRRGVNIVNQLQAAAGEQAANIPGLEPASAQAGGTDQKRLTLSLTNIPLIEALRYVTQLADLDLRIDPSTVSIVPHSVSIQELITKEYKMPPGFMNGAHAAAFGTDSVSAVDFFESRGVQFPAGSSAVYFPETRRLIIRNNPENLQLIDGAVEAQKTAPEPLPEDEINAVDQPYSTFSLHVSDVSFLLARASLAAGQLPDPESIRAEEFYNAFDYADPTAATGEKIACHIEQAAHPMLQQRNLVRIAMKVADTGRGQGQPLRLTVLLDTSGSMKREDRAAAVQRAMQVLASLLGPNDAVTLISFARQPRLIAEEMPGDQAGKLVDIVKHTPAEGGTNMEEALKTASELALRDYQTGAQNRVVMMTDGAANLGNADPEQLARIVDRLRQQGISFDACGVGADGLNDDVLEALTRKGGGRYYFLNGPDDADGGFARQLAGAFRPAAENVKMQVRFNAGRVGKYRLIGFDKNRLNQEDFRNDKVTAAQLAVEEAAVAMYQVQVLPEGEGEIGEVFVRFRDPTDGRMVEQSWTIPYDPQAPAMDKATPSMQLAATSSLLAEKLRGGAVADAVNLDALEPIMARVRGDYAQQPLVQDLARMFEQVRQMTAHK